MALYSGPQTVILSAPVSALQWQTGQGWREGFADLEQFGSLVPFISLHAPV